MKLWNKGIIATAQTEPKFLYRPLLLDFSVGLCLTLIFTRASLELLLLSDVSQRSQDEVTFFSSTRRAHLTWQRRVMIIHSPLLHTHMEVNRTVS